MKVKVGLGDSGIANLALNRLGVESISFIDVDNACVDVTEDVRWLCQQISEGKAILLPYCEELYTYNEAVTDFLNRFELFIPDNTKVKKFLADRGLLQTFYDFYECKIAENLLKWGKKKQIEFIDE